MRMTIAVAGEDGIRQLWEPTTMREAGKDEQYLENAIAAAPELLCLQTRERGIYAPYAVFTQLPLGTPFGREVWPDVTLLTASGDVVIVEVKLFDNPEIRDRRVIAQVIDYVSSLSALDEDGLASLFNAGHAADWLELVRRHFPDEADPEDLATTLLTNAREGNVHLVIACDKAPQGTFELARSVSAQSHLGFSLDVVEVTPYVPRQAAGGEIMLVPSVRLSTEIVARTAIKVDYPPDGARPSVSIETTSVTDIEENLRAAEAGTRRNPGRMWSNAEIEDVFVSSDDPVVRDLFLFAKEEGFEGRFQSGGPKISPAFGFYLRVRRPDGSAGGNQVFNCTADGGDSIWVYVNNYPKSAVTPDDLEAFKTDLRGLLGARVEVADRDVKIPTAALADRLDGFKDVIRAFQRRLDVR